MPSYLSRVIVATLRWWSLPVALLVESALWKFAMLPAACCCLFASSCLALATSRTRGTLRLVLGNLAALAAIFLVFELICCNQGWGWLGSGHPNPRASAAPASAAANSVVILTRAKRERPPWPTPKLRGPSIEPKTWLESFDARGLRLRASGPMYPPSREGTFNWILPSQRLRVIKDYQRVTLYDVVYTTSPRGFRVTRPTDEEVSWPDVRGTVLFFGGSFTFGEAVDDDQTLPSYLQQQSGGRLRARNFGLGGGGAHEMLALLEDERERGEVGAERPILAVYTLTYDHIRGALGKTGAWQAGRPHYVLRAGASVREGAFGDREHPLHFPAPLLPESVSSSFCNSALLCRVLSQLERWPAIDTAKGVELWRAMVRRARDILRERYGIPLLVLHWEIGPELDPKLQRALVADGIPVMTTASLFSSPAPRVYTPIDGHPTAAAYALLADALVTQFEAGATP